MSTGLVIQISGMIAIKIAAGMRREKHVVEAHDRSLTINGCIEQRIGRIPIDVQCLCHRIDRLVEGRIGRARDLHETYVMQDRPIIPDVADRRNAR